MTHKFESHVIQKFRMQNEGRDFTYELRRLILHID